MMLFILCFLV